MKHIVLFDGVCNFCNSSVQFIINRDPKGTISFASQQSEIGEQLLAEQGLNGHDSIVYIENGKAYTKSSAALRIARHLSGMWPATAIFFAIPRPIRDIAYDVVAKNRYRWFGKTDSCMIPPPSIRKRFLHD